MDRVQVSFARSIIHPSHFQLKAHPKSSIYQKAKHKRNVVAFGGGLVKREVSRVRRIGEAPNTHHQPTKAQNPYYDATPLCVGMHYKAPCRRPTGFSEPFLHALPILHAALFKFQGISANRKLSTLEHNKSLFMFPLDKENFFFIRVK